jgi:acyl-CoA synthetase (AMP-forming)/AMP-acid ligase II
LSKVACGAFDPGPKGATFGPLTNCPYSAYAANPAASASATTRQRAHPEFASYDLTSLRTGIMAGAPCPIEIMKRVIRDMHMEQITIAYGMTETSPVSFQSSTDDPIERRVSTVGRIHPHVQVRIVDPLLPGRAHRLAGRNTHPRLFRHEGILERPGTDPGRDR